MNTANLIESLERFGRSLPTVVERVSATDAKWKPADGAWSILEIVTHLCDEEVEDFRTRVRMILENPKKDWPEIHPSQWAIDRKYNEGDLRKVVDRFVRERTASIGWLKSLNDPDWSIARANPKFRLIRAGDLLTSWAAHDALHLRQIAKRLYQIAQRDGGEFSSEYAGEWTA